MTTKSLQKWRKYMRNNSDYDKSIKLKQASVHLIYVLLFIMRMISGISCYDTTQPERT